MALCGKAITSVAYLVKYRDSHPFVHFFFFSVKPCFGPCLLPYFVDAVNVSSRTVNIMIVMNVFRGARSHSHAVVK